PAPGAPRVTQRVGGQPRGKRGGNDVVWVAVQFKDGGVESPLRRGPVPALPGDPEAGRPARVVIEAVERHVRVAGVKVFGDDVTVGDDHQRRQVGVQVGAGGQEPGADAFL